MGHPWLGSVVVVAVAAGVPSWSGADQTAQPEAAVRVMRIPLDGSFGEDFDAEGVKECIIAAKRQRCSEIVFEINSPGGYIECAQKIATLMNQQDRSLRYHAVITQALGASMWILARCDTVFIAEDAAASVLGPGVTPADTSRADIDTKAVAELVAAATKKGVLPPLLVRAIVQPEARLYSWSRSDGSAVEFFDTPPDVDRFPGAIPLDTGDAALLLHGPQSTGLQLVRSASSFAEISRDWHEPADSGAAVMERNAARVHEIQTEVGAANAEWQALSALLEAARTTKHPGQFFDYSFIPGSLMELDKSGEELWDKRDQEWRAAWTSVGREAKKLQPKAQRLKGTPGLQADLEARIKEILSEAKSPVFR
jgi:hypothetical protein